MTKPRALKPIPRFRSEAAERRFWETHDTTEYIDWKRARLTIFPDLKPSTETISLRLPAGLLAELKAQANRRDVPYQSLLKVFLAERLDFERNIRQGRPAPLASRRSRRNPRPEPDRIPGRKIERS